MSTPQEPHVLEIRVHGIANTPPAAMLGLEASQVVRTAGDSGGSFWTPTPQALADIEAAPLDLPYDHRVPPTGVRREAYSWGALARLSAVPGWGAVTGVLHGVIRALWVLIIPFGLVNAAYWARNLHDGRALATGAAPARWWATSGAAGLVRLFGLLLTLLWTATAVTVTVGIIAAQCYVRPAPPEAALEVLDGVRYALVCDALPDVLDGLARWTTGQRVALLGLAALVVVLALALIASTGTVRFDRRMSPTRAGEVGDGPAEAGSGAAPTVRWPMLTQPGLWSHSAASWLMWALHLAAALSLVTLVLAWQLAATPGGGWWWWLPVAVAAVTIAFVAVRVATGRTEQVRPAGEPAPGWHAPWVVWVVAGLSLVLLLACLGLVARTGEVLAAEPGEVWRLVALDHLVPALVAALTLLVVAAAGARTSLPWWSTGGLVVAALVAGLLAAGPARTPVGARVPAVLAVLAVVALVAFVAVAPPANGTDPAHEGWRGRGTAVFLALAGGFALVLTGAVVAGTVAWLRAVPAAQPFAVTADVAEELAELDTDPLRAPVVTFVPGAASTEIATPPGYDGFAVTSLAAVVVLVVTVAVLAARTLALRGTPVPGRTPADPDGAHRAVRDARRWATLAHRAEPVVGLLALSLWLAMAASLFIRPFAPAAEPAASDSVPDHGWAVIALPLGLRDWSTGFVLLAFVLLVGSVGLGGSNAAVGRPWGLLWDLTCFLPRVAHPFAAPCYAERVVPELRSRIDEWLGVDPGAQVRADAVATAQTAGVVDDTLRERKKRALLAERAAVLARRRVVVSAHSLGAVVAVSALFARWTPDPVHGPFARAEDIALLTYGTQLRSHFGRFFPELFGPDVLGTEPSAGPRLWAADPWAADVAAELRPGQPRRGSLVGLLSTLPPVPVVTGAAGTPATAEADGHLAVLPPGTRPRWRSLWRRTDYMGFPVDSYHPEGTPRRIDHYESEVDETAYLFTVGTHGGDVRTPEYRAQLVVLIELLPPA